MKIRLDQIIQGDCVEWLRKLPAGFVDLLFADPPFNIGYDYDVYRDDLSTDEYLRWTEEWVAAASRVLKPNGSFWISIGDEYAAEIKVLLQRHKLLCRSWVVWFYTFGVNCQKKFTRSHVHLFHMVRDPKDFVFNAESIKVPSARQLVYNDKRATAGGRLPDDTWILRPQDAPEAFQPLVDTWYYPRVAGTHKERAGFHGCQMPEQLLGRIIRVSSDEGQVVLDPFAGSATTLAVAKKLKRKFLGFELSPEYVKHGCDRLAAIAPGDPLSGSEDPLRPIAKNKR